MTLCSVVKVPQTDLNKPAKDYLLFPKNHTQSDSSLRPQHTIGTTETVVSVWVMIGLRCDKNERDIHQQPLGILHKAPHSMQR